MPSSNVYLTDSNKSSLSEQMQNLTMNLLLLIYIYISQTCKNELFPLLITSGKWHPILLIISCTIYLNTNYSDQGASMADNSVALTDGQRPRFTTSDAAIWSLQCCQQCRAK